MIEVVRGSLFIDIDGTIIHTQTEEPLPHAVEKINAAYDDDVLIVLTTFRGDKYWEENDRFSKSKTLELLKSIELKYHQIVWDSPSPRIVINDDVCSACQHEQNGSWENVQI